jgi:outer membrane protein OmpA-like peptidoglycan-associated protein
MFWKALTTLLCIAAAAALFGWTGRFHIVVGLPMLALMAVLGWKMGTRDDDEMDDLRDIDDETPGVGHGLFVGGLQGAAVVGVLALAFVGVSSTPLRALIEGPDCRAILGQIDILASAQAHARIVQVVDTSLQRALGLVCRQDLCDRKVRALLALAEEAAGTRRLELLEQAHGVAVEDADLKQLVVSRVHAEKERLASEQQVKANAEHLARIADENKDLSQVNQQLKAQNDALQKLAKALKMQHFTVEETPAGIKVILSEKDALRFAPDTAVLDDNGRATVGRLATLLTQEPYNGKRVRVIGHTDATRRNHGPLSEARARSVLQALVHHGVQHDRLDAQGAGAAVPVGNNTTAAGRAQNRRVEIFILKG